MKEDEAAGESTAKSKKSKEGTLLLGTPTFVDIGNGRWRCENTGHELPPNEIESYSRSKACRIALIDAAIANKNPPLNLFQSCTRSKSMLVCSLTGDVINKSEEHIWKHLNGRRFLKKLEKMEVVGEGNKSKNKKMSKKSETQVSSMHEKQNTEAYGNGSIAIESEADSSDSEGPDFWAPPVEEFHVSNDPIINNCEFYSISDQDTEVFDKGSILNENNEEESMDLCIRTKRMAVALGPNRLSRRKKKRKNSE